MKPHQTRMSTREEWLKVRAELKRTGASAAGSLSNVNPFQTRFKMWMIDTGRMPPFTGNEATRLGQRMEEPIAQAYVAEQAEAGRPIVLANLGAFTILTNEDYPYQLVTLDRSVLGPEGDIGRVVEIKNVGPRVADRWADEPPLYAQAQVQQQMAVSDCNVATVVALICGVELRHFHVERNDEFIKHLAELAHEYWTVNIAKDIPPQDVQAEDLDAVKLLHRGVEKGKTTALAPNMHDALFHWEYSKAQKLASEKVAKLHQAKLLLAIGDAEAATLPDGTIIKRSIVNKAEYTVNAHSYPLLRVIKPKGDRN